MMSVDAAALQRLGLYPFFRVVDAAPDAATVIIDGRRRGIRRPWMYLISSFFTSFAFAWAFYLATVERQRRHQQSDLPVGSRA